MDKMIRRARLLLSLGIMLTSVAMAMRCLQEELETIEEERLALEEDPEQARRLLQG
jgi:hypothetical protein